MNWTADLIPDVRDAARLVRRQPRFALLVVLTMALGISAATVLFGVSYAVLMKPLPWPAGDRLVVLRETRGGNPPRFQSFTNAAYLAWREGATTLDALAAWSQRAVTLGGVGDPERIRVTSATASLFRVLGVSPLVGSFFDEKDETSRVVVLSEGLWRQRFGGDPAVLGRAIHLDGEPYTVVGVLADEAAYPDRQSRAWVPFRVGPTAGNRLQMFGAVGTLRPGVTPEQAAAEGTGRGRFAADTGLTTTAIFGSDGPIEISAEPLRHALSADVRQPLIVLLAAVGLLLLTATANVASLQLARATTRRRELAIRAALGAGAARIVRQLLVESVMLGLLGGAAGLALTWLLHRVMPALLPADFPRIDALGVDRVVVAFALGVSMLTGVLIGLLPALRVRRLNLVESLTDDGAASIAGGGSRTARARMVIMAGQIAVACVLLVGASLLGRSFLALLHADRGFDPSHVMTARLSFPAALYTPERRFAIVERILDRLAANPAVTQAAFTSEMPLTPGGSSAAFSIPSRRADRGVVEVQASPRIVSPRFFPAIGMRLVEGRGFTDADTETSPMAVVVNRAFARRYLTEAPLGTKLPVAGYSTGGNEAIESVVVGVVEDVRYLTAGGSSQPELYYCHRQMRRALNVPVVTLIVKGGIGSAPLAAAIRAAVREADAALVAESVQPLSERLLTTLARPRLYAILLGGFAAFALAIAAVGLFGVLSYSVAQRSREIAVRSALGARRTDIVRLVLVQGLAVTVMGLAAGLIASTWLTRAIASQLYGVGTQDAVTYVVVPLVLAVAAAAASFVPAWRASRLDPLRVLKGN